MVHCTVTLYEAVNTPSTVSLQAFDPKMGPTGPLPGIGLPSDAVHMQPSVLIPAGSQSVRFQI